MAASMYRVGDCVYFECSSTMPYQIRKIEELCKTAAGTVEARVVCFFRRRDLSSSLIAAADKHHVAVEDGMENGDSTSGRNGDTVSNQVNDNRFHQLKCRELFLSRQVETLSATHIRGKCSVTLLSEAETPVVYLDKEDTFFYSLVYDAQAKSLIADHGDIRVGSRYQVEQIPEVLADGDTDDREMSSLEQLVWSSLHSPSDTHIDQLMMIAKSVGTFSRALDSVNTVRQPSLHMSAAAASRDITLFHAMDVLHRHNYDIVSSLQDLVPSTGPKLCRDQMEEWSASEANLFEEALDKYGKSFRDIWKDFLPWKSMKSIIEYYYMWKTTDRYVQQKRIKAAEAERKLKQVYIPSYNKPSPALINERQNGVDGSFHGRSCESCSTLRSAQWFTWGPVHSQCRLCSVCWIYWKKYGGLKKQVARPGSQETELNAVENHAKVMKCTLAGCGKEFRIKAHLVRHLTESHGLVLPTLLAASGGSADSPLSMMSSSGSAVKTRAAFSLVTTVLTRVSRQLCKNVFSVRRSGRCPFRPINVVAIKQECQQLLPELMKKIHQLKAKKRVSMNQVSARLGIDVSVDKPELLRPVTDADRKPPSRYAFPVPQSSHGETSEAVVITRKRTHEHTNGGGPPCKIPTTVQSIKTTEPKVRGSVNNLQNGLTSSGKQVNIRGRKHSNVNAESLDDVLFVASETYRKLRKRTLTTVTMKRAARKPWLLMSIPKGLSATGVSDNSVAVVQ